MNCTGTDTELLEQTQQDKDAFLCLVERYEKKLLRYIQRISYFSSEESEEILQEGFFKAFQNLHSFDPDISSFNSWIYRIIHNETINQIRKKQSRPLLLSLFQKQDDSDDEEMIEIPDDFDLEKEFEQKEKQIYIRKLIQKLSEKYKTILVLKFLEEKSYEEISDILKIPQGSVATRINRAKSKLKELIQK